MNTHRPDHAIRLALIAGSALPLALASPSAAIVLTWNNPAGGSASVAGNWNPVQAPAPADILNFNLAATYSVTFPTGVGTSAQQNYNFGNVSIAATSPHTVANQFVVALTAGSNAAVNVFGNFTMSGIMVTGGSATGTGVLTLADDSALVTSNAAAGVRVGNSGNGTLNILTGATLTVNSGPVQVGALAGSQGTLLVSGAASSSLRSELLLTHPTAGDLVVGSAGQGNMSITAGGLVVAGDDLNIAPSAGVTGTATVGSVTALTSTLTATDIQIGSNTIAGVAAGSATLNVQAGGSVAANTTTVGDPDGGSGTLNLTGGLMTTSTLTVDPINGDLLHAGGELRITGSFTNSTALPYRLPGATGTTPATLHFRGTGVTGALPGGFLVGNFASGPGHLVIADGATVTSSPVGVGIDRQSVGPDAGTLGAITISGAGSALNLNAVSAVLLGNAGSAELTIQDGGVLRTFQPVSCAVFPGTTFQLTMTTGALEINSALRLGGNTTTPGGVATATISGGSVVRFVSLLLHEPSSMTIDDSVIEAYSTGLLNSATINGSLSLLNGAELVAESVSVSGEITGTGTISGDVTIQPGGTIVAVGGDLTIGSPTGGNDGFVNRGTLFVSNRTVRLLDGDGSPGGNIHLAGGHLISNGLTFGPGDSLGGSGGITSPITINNAFVTAGAGGLVFNGPVNATAATPWGGGRFFFAAGGGFTGTGAIESPVSSEEEAPITATNRLTLGNNGSDDGVVLNGPLHVGPHEVSLRSNTPAILGVVTTIDGGLLLGPADNARTLQLPPPFNFSVLDVVPIELPAGGSLEGTGTIGHKLRTRPGSTVTLTGPLSIVGSEFPNVDIGPQDNGRRFAQWQGTLNVGPHALVFVEDDHRFDPGTLITIAGGSITAPRMALHGTLTGHGTLASAAANSLIANGGTMRPGGSSTGEITISGDFANQSSILLGGSPLGILEIDLSGDQGFAHDQILISDGNALLNGTLSVNILDAEPPPGHVYTILRCENGTVSGQFSTVTLPTLSFGGSLEVRYTASTVQVVVRAACLADFNQDGNLDPDDLSDFITCFFTQVQAPGACPGADFNTDGNVDPDDLADFITAFFTGCN